jgi:hypothetical protein
MNESYRDICEYPSYANACEITHYSHEINDHMQERKKDQSKDKKSWVKMLFQKVIVLFVGVTSVVMVVEATPQSLDLEIYDLSYHYLALILTTDGSGTVEIQGDDYFDVYDFEPYEASYPYPHEEPTSDYTPEYFIEFVGLRSGAWYEIKVKDSLGYIIHKESVKTLILDNPESLAIPEIAYFSYYSDGLNQTLYLPMSLNDPYHFLYDFEYIFLLEDRQIEITSLKGSIYGGVIDMTLYDFSQVYQVMIRVRSRHPLMDSQSTYVYDILYEGEGSR